MNQEPVEAVAEIDWGEEPPPPALPEAKPLAPAPPPAPEPLPEIRYDPNVEPDELLDLLLAPAEPPRAPDALVRAIVDVGAVRPRKKKKYVFHPEDCFIAESEALGRQHLLWADSDNGEREDLIGVVKLIAHERGLKGDLIVTYDDHQHGFHVLQRDKMVRDRHEYRHQLP